MRDIAAFFRAVRLGFGKLSQSQVFGLEFLVDSMEHDRRVKSVQYAAYMLATVWRETGKTCQPIREWGSDEYLDRYDTGRLAKALGNTPWDDDDGQWFCGRGYSMITGADNYKAFQRILKIPLVEHPDLALVPRHAYEILVIGMTRGKFTGKCLAEYFNDSLEDPTNARRIVNGLDKASLIATYYDRFLAALTVGGFREPHPSD